MLFRNKLILAVSVALLIAGTALFILENQNNGTIPKLFSLDNFFSRSEENAEETIEDPTGDRVINSANSELPLTYQNKQFGFELDLPEGYTGSSFSEGVGVTVLLQNPETRKSFQIYIAPFDEPGPITVQRIWVDLPELVITEPQVAIIASGKIEALIFIGESETFGKTREVWFVHDGQLYQVIAPFEMEKTIGPIMESLRFN